MRPNIVLIVSDDHGHADRSALGIHPDVRTPALDRLAAEGVTCSDAYVSAPICSPSRSGMISGRHQQRWGGLWFSTSQFPPDHEPTIAETLQRQGYRTGYFGKVHYGREDVGDRACPPHHGFETTLYGLAGQSEGRLHYMHRSAELVEQSDPEVARRTAVLPLHQGDEPYEFEGFLTDELGQAAREFIADEEDERPFFCMLAFNAVHNFCWQLPPEELERRGLPAHADWQGPDVEDYGEWYDDVIVPNLPHGREYYLAQLELMDAQIGAVLDQLDQDGQAGNTIVVYLTDNGGSTCNWGDNTPYRGTKYTLWEGGIRVPMIWRWPGHVSPGGQTDVPVSSLDLHATFAAASGAAVPDGLDGVDLAAVFDGAELDRTLHWECGFQWAIRDGDWKLYAVDPESETAAQLRHKEHAPVGSGVHLARLDQDPGEQTNLAQDHPEQVTRLSQLHQQWRVAVGLPDLVE